MKNYKEHIITIGHFAWSRALLLQILLQDSGIDCFIVSKDAVLTQGFVDLRVNEADTEKAIRIIETSVADIGTAKESAFIRLQSIRRILVPVDFSEISFNACRFATSVAGKYKAEVKLLHVYYNPAMDISPYADHYSYQIKLSESLREIEKSARENMLKLETKLKTWCNKENLSKVHVSTKLVNGFNSEEILYYSLKYHPAIIIMGTRGLTRDNYKAFGHVTSRVIEQSKIPVLALPSGSVKSVHEIKNILYATDFDPSDYSAINKLIQMLNPFGIVLHCVHVSFVNKKPWENLKMKELKEHLINQYVGVGLHFEHIATDNILNGLETYIRDHTIDALAVTTHKRNLLEKLFLPSMTRKIFSETGKPLLIFHSKEK